MKSFGADNPQNRLLEIISEYKDFLKDDLNSLKANNLCINIWQLSDWVFKYNEIEDSLPIFRSILFSKCPELKIMHDIANTSKHFELSRPKSDLKEARTHSGTFDHTFDFTFDITRLEIELENGEVIWARRLFQITLDFWIEYVFINYNIKLSYE